MNLLQCNRMSKFYKTIRRFLENTQIGLRPVTQMLGHEDYKIKKNKTEVSALNSYSTLCVKRDYFEIYIIWLNHHILVILFI